MGNCIPDTQLLTHCAEIGLYNWSMPPVTCLDVCTDDCRTGCYKFRYYHQYPQMNAAFFGKQAMRWAFSTGEQVKREFSRKRRFKDRARAPKDGEIFSNDWDLQKAKEIFEATADVHWMVVTKGWRLPKMRQLIEQEIMPMENISLLASTDSTTSVAEDAMLHDCGWSTLRSFDDQAKTTPAGRKLRKCPKCWAKDSGISCWNCKGGCFLASATKQVDILLKTHSYSKTGAYGSVEDY